MSDILSAAANRSNISLDRSQLSNDSGGAHIACVYDGTYHDDRGHDRNERGEVDQWLDVCEDMEECRKAVFQVTLKDAYKMGFQTKVYLNWDILCEIIET